MSKHRDSGETQKEAETEEKKWKTSCIFTIR